jgi:hypothetical protein
VNEMRTRALHLALTLAVAALPVLGCQAVTIDLGSNHPDAGTGGEPAPSMTSATCPALSDSEGTAMEGKPCPATCAEGAGTPRVVSSGAELEAIVSGRWQTCSGTPPWDAGAVGLEFQAGCTLFVLYDAGSEPDAGVVRGVGPDDQGTYDVVETTAGASVTWSLALHFPGGTWAATVTESDCPHHLLLARGPAEGGDLAFAGMAGASPLQ